VTSPRGALTCD